MFEEVCALNSTYFFFFISQIFPRVCEVTVAFFSGVFSGQYRDEAVEKEVVCAV